jgi:omega-hydroxy-beta-dihydromenaquinone-9 sulfotransferase
LARALTVAYTPYHADDALGRLARLLNVRLTGHSYEAFRGWGLAEELGIERYRAAVGRLWQQLTWYEFDEAVPPLGYRSGCRTRRASRGCAAGWWPATFSTGPS